MTPAVLLGNFGLGMWREAFDKCIMCHYHKNIMLMYSSDLQTQIRSTKHIYRYFEKTFSSKFYDSVIRKFHRKFKLCSNLA